MTLSLIRISAATLLLSIILAFSGIGHMQMMDNKMQMGDCPFAPGTSLCAMSVTDHIGMVSNVFSAPLLFAGALASILLLIACALCVLVLRLFTIALCLRERRFAYALARIHAPPRSFLQELFSNGVLHSKAF